MGEISHEEWERQQEEKREQARGAAAGAAVGLGCLGYAFFPVVGMLIVVAFVLLLGVFRGC